MMTTANNTKTNQIETLRASCRKHTVAQLKEIATVSTNQIKVLTELVLEFPANDSNKEKVANLRSVRAATIDVIVERLGEKAGDKFMDELGL